MHAFDNLFFQLNNNSVVHKIKKKKKSVKSETQAISLPRYVLNLLTSNIVYIYVTSLIEYAKTRLSTD